MGEVKKKKKKNPVIKWGVSVIAVVLSGDSRGIGVDDRTRKVGGIKRGVRR